MVDRLPDVKGGASVKESMPVVVINPVFGEPEDDPQTKFGKVLAVDAADAPVDIWDFASDDLTNRQASKTWQTTAGTLYIASDASGDTSLDFTVDYYDSTGALQQATVSTDGSNGQTPVSLAVSGLDVFRIRLTGDDQSHAGNIYVTKGTGYTLGVPDDLTTVLGFIRAGDGITNQCAFRVPTGKVAMLQKVLVSISRASGAAGSATVDLLVKRPSGSWNYERTWPIQQGDFERSGINITLAAGTWVRLVVADVSDADTNLTGEVDFQLRDA